MSNSWDAFDSMSFDELELAAGGCVHNAPVQPTTPVNYNGGAIGSSPLISPLAPAHIDWGGITTGLGHAPIGGLLANPTMIPLEHPMPSMPQTPTLPQAPAPDIFHSVHHFAMFRHVEVDSPK
jgi:hypothetical protein